MVTPLSIPSQSPGKLRDIQDIYRVFHCCGGLQTNCPESREAQGHPGHVPSVPLQMAQVPMSIPVLGNPRTFLTCPKHPTLDSYNPTIPPQSRRKPRDIPDMSRASHSRWLQPHCLSHPRVPGTSQTHPKRPTLDSSIPTVHPIPEPREAQVHIPEFQKPRDILDMPRVSHSGGLQSHCLSHPRSPGTSQTCPECPTLVIPMSIPSQSPRKPKDIPDMSQASHSRWLQFLCPSHPKSPGKLRDVLDMSRVSHCCGGFQTHRPSFPRVTGSPGTSRMVRHSDTAQNVPGLPGTQGWDGQWDRSHLE